MRHIISLSTIPPRFAGLGLTLSSLVAQRSRPEGIFLYIPQNYRRFPQWGGALPVVPDGVTIKRVDEDLGPATKILPAAQAYRGHEVEIIYTDDDQICSRNWADGFLNTRRAHPGSAVCAAGMSLEQMGRPWKGARPEPQAQIAPRLPDQLGFQVRKILRQALAELFGRKEAKMQPKFRKVVRSGYVDTASGFSGVAVRPDFFDDLAFSIPERAWTVDDVWLSGHLARRGIPIWADASLNRCRAINQVERTEPLFTAVIDGLGRREANQTCVDYMRATYGIWGGEAVQST